MITLSRLFVYPVKSMRGLQLSHTQALESGLAFDRVFMLTEPDGTFISARQFPEMVLFTPILLPEGLLIIAPDNSKAFIRFADFSSDSVTTEVWGNSFIAHVASDSINEWLSNFFPRPVQLRWTGTKPARRVERFEQVPLSFADGFPYLLINMASLRDLQKRCPAGIRPEQFRPNLLISGADAWDEDSWKRIKIGEVTFDMPKPCSRCVFTTIGSESGRRHPDGEPLATLQRFRSAKTSGDIDFGVNLIALNSGIIRAGDSVTVLERQTPRIYQEREEIKTLKTTSLPPAVLKISYCNEQFAGDNQQVLLDQLEMKGFRIPYSCRAGICGSCRMTLVSGNVKALKQSAVCENGTILCCSCIPEGDIELK
ncbi:MOSC N-terminal beta barrel domain-containing protein [Duffyella gerundensis]|uniref:MOSC N-terminal beta barrel domain-containing protein n=1 Tax=Duffyella gerundensis TaxID=1619313 RepID=UPI003FD4DCD8